MNILLALLAPLLVTCPTSSGDERFCDGGDPVPYTEGVLHGPGHDDDDDEQSSPETVEDAPEPPQEEEEDKKDHDRGDRGRDRGCKH